MRIKIAVQNPPGVQMLAGSGQALRQIQHHGQGETLLVVVDVPCARRQIGRAGQTAIFRVDPRHHQASAALRVPAQFTNHPNQVGVITRCQTGRHFFGRKAVTGDCPLKQFNRHGLPGHGLPGLLRRRLPVGLMNYSRGAFA